MLAEVGAGITLSPNASRVFLHLGLGEGVRALGFIPPKQITQNLATGAILVERERGAAMEAQYGAPYMHLHRHDLHALLGDAAHGMLPFMGQGAATSMEDGMVLARFIVAFPRDEALRRYEAARLERTTMIQVQSRLLGLQFQGKNPESFGKGPIKNEETLGLFAYDAVNCPI